MDPIRYDDPARRGVRLSTAPPPGSDPPRADPPRSGPPGFGRSSGDWLESAHRHNPFYLMSAACMLGGCLLLTNSLSWVSIPLPRLLALLATLCLYDLLLFSLGLFLTTRAHADGVHSYLRRDAAQLLGLSAVFMADAAFVVSEVVSLSLSLGAVVSGLILAMAAGKAAMLVRLTDLRPTRLQWAAAALLLAGVFAVPLMLKAVGDTRVTGGHLYAAWWLAAALWLVFDLAFLRPDGDASRVARRAAGVHGLARGRARLPVSPLLLLGVVPMVSLLTHIAILHYVYNRAFTAGHAAPVLLLLTLVIARIPASLHPMWQAVRRGLAWQLPLAALGISLGRHTALTLILPGGSAVSPFAVTLVCAILLLVYLHAARWLPQAVACVLVVGLLFAFGPPAAEVTSFASSVGYSIGRLIAEAFGLVLSSIRWLLSAVWSLVPRSPAQWGLCAVGTSFLLLLAGAVVSLRKPPAGPRISRETSTPPPLPDAEPAPTDAARSFPPNPITPNPMTPTPA